MGSKWPHNSLNFDSSLPKLPILQAFRANKSGSSKPSQGDQNNPKTTAKKIAKKLFFKTYPQLI
jgi:hypothetical protein